MRLKLVAAPVLLALAFAACNKKQKAQTIGEGSTPAGGASVAPSASPPTTVNAGTTPTPPAKVAVDQTAQVIVYGYHRFVNQVRRPDTEITPQMFEQQMQELKNRGITVIGMQDFLAWKRGEKNIPPRCAIITFDDGWKSQYDVAWPIMKKFGYTFTMFIYTEGVNEHRKSVAKFLHNWPGHIILRLPAVIERDNGAARWNIFFATLPGQEILHPDYSNAAIFQFLHLLLKHFGRDFSGRPAHRIDEAVITR